MKTIIIGMGNPLLSDDSVGLKVADELKIYFEGNNDITVEGTSWGGFRVVELILGYEHAIIIDSIKTGKEPFGFVHQFSPDDFAGTLRVGASHDLHLAAALEFVKQSGIDTPDDIIIYAIEVEETSVFSEKCTPNVEKAIEQCCHLVIEKLG